MSRLLFALLCCASIQCFGMHYMRYWDSRYLNGDNSGLGSIGILASYKADIVNEIIEKYAVDSVVEFGFGDGYVLNLMNIKQYLGFEPSPFAVSLCTGKFAHDESKIFLIYHPQLYTNRGYFKADLVVCLDVLYNVVDDNDFEKLLNDIFSYDAPIVVLFTTLFEGSRQANDVMKHRDLFDYLLKYSDYEIDVLPQKYPQLSASEFVVMTKIQG